MRQYSQLFCLGHVRVRLLTCFCFTLSGIIHQTRVRLLTCFCFSLSGIIHQTHTVDTLQHAGIKKRIIQLLSRLSSLLKQQSTGRYVSPLGHIILIQSRHVSPLRHIILIQSRHVSSLGHIILIQSRYVSPLGHIILIQSRHVSPLGHIY